MNRIVTGFAGFLAFWLCLSVQSSVSVQELSFKVEPNSLNVRSEPSSRGAKVDRLTQGTEAIVYGRRGPWARISLSENRWVYSAYLVRQLSGDLKYSVIDGNIIPGIKLSLDVRLSRKASERELRQIAQELKNAARGSYARIFIAHLLPGMAPDEGAWATTHFNPSLKVVILGMTREQVKNLTRTANTSQNVIGVWLFEASMLSGRITL